MTLFVTYKHRRESSKINNIIVRWKENDYFLSALSHDFVCHSFTSKMKKNLFNFVYKWWIVYAIHSSIRFDERNRQQHIRQKAIITSDSQITKVSKYYSSYLLSQRPSFPSGISREWLRVVIEMHRKEILTNRAKVVLLSIKSHASVRVISML
jgi:hypothetical protein